MPAAPDCDVLIIGAGPTGSVAALLLAAAGLRVVIADKASDIYPLPRAAHIDHEAVRIFQSIGLAEPIMASCRQATRYDFVNKAGEILLRFDHADRIDAGGWPAANMIHQPSIERVLHDKLATAEGVTLHIEWRLSELFEDPAQVRATFATPDGDASITARYLIGADGTHSPVRTLAGITLDDLAFDEVWLVLDALVHDASRLPTINLQICDPARPTTCVVMGSGRHRWEFMLRPGETAEQALASGFIETLLEPWDVAGAIDVERAAVYRFNARVATEWRRGRILLAGDAAHQMPPFAGQGLCSGLRDATNLAWKLAAIIADDADDALLDTYQTEREPHVRGIIGLAIMMGRTVCEIDPEAAAARDIQMIAARTAAGAEIRPPSQPLATGCLLPGCTTAGNYFPQALAGDPPQRLDDILGPGAWLITRATLAEPRLAPFRAHLTAWFDDRGVEAVLVRPDRYVFGTGDPAALEQAWATRLAGTPFATSIKEDTMIDGTYDVTVKAPMGEQKTQLVVKADGANFTGTNSGANGSQEIAGTIEGNTLIWQQKITTPMPLTLDMTATIDGDAVSGSAKAGLFGSFPLTGTRAA